MRTAFTHLKTPLLIAVVGVILGLYAFGPRTPLPEQFAHAQSGTVDVLGYAWSSNAGWISFNCANAGGCSTSNYGVKENLSTGALSGYAWSNLGWITFNNADLSGCPSGTCAASINLSSGAASGWARACAAFADKNACSGTLESGSGDWDGWIHLSGTSYGPTQGTDCTWSGYAWGSDNFGWIHFSGSSYNVHTDSTGCNQATATLNASPTVIDGTGTTTTTTLTWSSTGASSCTSTNFTTGGATSGSVSVSVTHTTVFNVTCGNGGNSATANALVTVNYPAPDVSISASPSLVHQGQTTTLSWTVANVASATCSISKQGGGWSTSISNTHSGSGSVTSPVINAQSIFVLSCTGLDDSTPSDSVTVGLIPVIQEI